MVDLVTQKRQILGDFSRVVSTFRDGVAGHKAQVQHMKIFANSLVSIVQKQAPELRENIKHTIAILVGIIEQDESVVTSEERLLEDLNDINIRFDHLAKKYVELTNMLNTFNGMKRKILDIENLIQIDQTQGGTRLPKLKGDLARIKVQRNVYHQTYLNAMERYVEIKSHYYGFFANRLRNGYKTYGTRLKESSEIQNTLIEQLLRECSITPNEVVTIITGKDPNETEENE